MNIEPIRLTEADTAPPAPIVRDWSRRPTLVLNSNSFMRNILINVLRDAGVRDIMVETHASRAMHALREISPALIVADWAEQADPDEDRVRLLQRIRASQGSHYRETPVILMSAPRPRADIERARDAGASEYLVTPLAPITLINRLKSLQTDQRAFVDSSRFAGPDRRRRPRRERKPGFKRSSDVEAGLTTPMEAARRAALALAHETRLSGDPLAIRVGRSLQRFIALQDTYTSAESEVVEMHRAALALLTRMADNGDPLRDPVVTGLEMIVDKRLGQR
ncbi:response regulator [Maricaulis sp.]|uniref:response regulator n=1 Tax=Maricaulis sp. TaxID=1486257 RepID=UPI003A8D28F1